MTVPSGHMKVAVATQLLQEVCRTWSEKFASRHLLGLQDSQKASTSQSVFATLALVVSVTLSRVFGDWGLVGAKYAARGCIDSARLLEGPEIRLHFRCRVTCVCECEASKKRKMEKDENDGAKGQKWKKQHECFREAGGMAMSAAMWTQANPGIADPTSRVGDLMNIAWEVAKRNNTEMDEMTLAKRLYLDTSQAVARQPWTTTACLRTLTTSSRIFSFHRKRHLLAEEHLRALGFPPHVCEKVAAELSPAQMMDLAAEAMAVPCVTLFSLAILTCLPGVFKPV
eukprot:6465197-Amphidinium_carterae.1